MDSDSLALLGIWYVIFLLSLTCHEAAHGLAAKWGGDPTAFHGGQVSLNPIPHIRREPFGTVLVPFATYLLSGWMMGWASAPYDPLWQQRHPHRAAWMALAGPLANLILVIVAGAAIRTGIRLGPLDRPETVVFTRVVAASAPGTAEGVALFLSILFSLNLLLAAFNLLPFPPLDGNSAIGLLMPARAALRFAQLSHNPMFSLAGIVLAWQLFDSVFYPVFHLGLRLLYG